jgi:hypothetical protein
MRRSGFLMITAMALFFASCGKDPIPQDIHFSVLGDSYSTFEGYVDPENNDVWYQLPPNNFIDVMSVEDMWWYKVAAETGWTLEKNNSFSGSLICNFWGYNSGPYYSPHSFIRRMDDLGNPDVIFVFGGANDVWNGAYCGEYVYSDWTEGQLEQYRPALAYLFDHLERRYPEAKIYFLVDMDLSTTDMEQFVESVHTVANHYRINCIDLYDIQKDWAHPNAQGMSDIAAQVVASLRKSFNV